MRKKLTDFKKKYPITLVVWDDSQSTDAGGWKRQEAVVEHLGSESLCYSAGFLLKENKKYLIMASHATESETEVSGEMCIPKCSIVHRKNLR